MRSNNQSVKYKLVEQHHTLFATNQKYIADTARPNFLLCKYKMDILGAIMDSSDTLPVCCELRILIAVNAVDATAGFVFSVDSPTDDCCC